MLEYEPLDLIDRTADVESRCDEREMSLLSRAIVD